MQNIFVSYRREDSPDVTGRIFDHLKSAFGEEHLFKDVDSIPLGTDFRAVISDAIQRCDVLLVIIGEDWLEVKDKVGGRRLDDPDDYVRLEIGAALERNIPVIPVLVGGATIPTQERLPAPLQRLAFRNALFVRPDPDFHNDVERLCRDLRRFLKIPDPLKKHAPRWRMPAMIATAGVVVLAAVAVIVSLSNSPQTISGNTVNTVNTMTVNNVAVILQEYEKYQGTPLVDDALKELISQAVNTAAAGKHRESVQLLEQIAAKAPVPAILNNLGVEYAKLNQVDRARAAFAKAIDKDPGYEPARANQKLLANTLAQRQQPSPASKATQGITFEKSPVAAMLIEKLEGHDDALQDVHVVKSGTKLSGSYSYAYSLTPGTPTLVDPGTYDVLCKTTGGGTFVLAQGIDVKSGTRARINPNPLVGSIVVAPLTRSGFPGIKELSVFEAGSTGYRLVLQHTDKLGVPLPIVPGRYDIQGTTTDGDEFVLAKNVEVKAREVARIKTDEEVAAVVVHDPNVAGAQVEAIYVLRAGKNEIVAQTKQFDRPMMVPPDDAYDIALKQAGGRATIASNVIPKRGELTEIPPAR